MDNLLESNYHQNIEANFRAVKKTVKKSFHSLKNNSTLQSKTIESPNIYDLLQVEDIEVIDSMHGHSSTLDERTNDTYKKIPISKNKTQSYPKVKKQMQKQLKVGSKVDEIKNVFSICFWVI